MTLELQKSTLRARTDAWRQFGGLIHWSANLAGDVEFACGESVWHLSYLLPPRVAGPAMDAPEPVEGWEICEDCQTAREAAGYPPFD